jgi:uncharacterized membrane protein YeiH
MIPTMHLPVSTLSLVIEVAGTLAGALSGIVDARRKGMDLVGVYAVGLITAFGGGTVRDLLLDRRPFFWMQRPLYIFIILAIALLYLYAPAAIAWLTDRRAQTIALVFDALALGFFGMLGASYALERGHLPIIAVLIGVITGVFGGVMRDIIINEVPVVFTPGGFYATAVFIGGAVFTAARTFGMSRPLAANLGIILTVTLRLLSIRYGLKLPAPRELRPRGASPVVAAEDGEIGGRGGGETGGSGSQGSGPE